MVAAHLKGVEFSTVVVVFFDNAKWAAIVVFRIIKK
jgi:hypothetical protein